MYVKISKSPTAFEKYFTERTKDEDIIHVFEASPVTPVKSFSYDAYTEAPGDPTSVAEDNAEDDDNDTNANATATNATNTTTTTDNAADDTQANDDPPTEDATNDDPPEVPNQPTSAAEDSAAEDDNEDTAGDDAAADDEDTAEDDTTDDGEDAGDDTAEDEGGEEDTTDDTADNTEGEDNGEETPPDEDAVKKFSYYSSFLRLYTVIDTFVDKLQRLVRHTPISNAVVKVAVDKLTEIQDDLYDFMLTKYADVPYYQVRNYFETSILAIQYVFELLKNNRITM